MRRPPSRCRNPTSARNPSRATAAANMKYAALQRRIPKSDVFQHIRRQVFEPRLGVRVREQLGQLFVEADIHADDGGGGRFHRFVDVAGVEARLQLFLRLLRLHEDDSHRAHVGGRRAHFGEVVDAPQQVFVDRGVQPGAMRLGVAEDKIETFIIERLGHDVPSHLVK